MVEYKYNKRDKVTVAINRIYDNYFIIDRFNLNCVNYYTVTRTLVHAETSEIEVEIKVVSENQILMKIDKDAKSLNSLKDLLRIGTLVVDTTGCVYQYIPLQDFDFSFCKNYFSSESRIEAARAEGIFLDSFGHFILVYDYNDDLEVKSRNDYDSDYDIDEIYYPKKFWHIGEKAIMEFMNTSNPDDWTLVWQRN